MENENSQKPHASGPKKQQKIIRGFLTGFFGILLVLAGLFYFGVLSPAMFGTFRVEKESRREVEVAAPLQQVMMNLMAADVQSQLMKQLDIIVLEQQSVKKDMNIKPMQLLSGQWSVDVLDEMVVETSDMGMGRLLLKMHTQTHARPGLVETKTVLAEPTPTMNAFQQTITMTPVPENPGKTKIAVVYTTDVNVPYPELSFIKKMAELQIAKAHEDTLNVICDVFEKNAVSPQLPALDMHSDAEEESVAVEQNRPASSFVAETEPETDSETAVETASDVPTEGFEGFEGFESSEELPADAGASA